MSIEEFLPKRDRISLATALNTLLASPTFESWRTEAPLDIAGWVAPRAAGRTPAEIVSVGGTTMGVSEQPGEPPKPFDSES